MNDVIIGVTVGTSISPEKIKEIAGNVNDPVTEEQKIIAALLKYLEKNPVPGTPGEDGFSPIAKVTQTDDGAVITITDKNGTTEAVVKNGNVTVDSEMSDTSENPVQNKVVKAYIDGKIGQGNGQNVNGLSDAEKVLMLTLFRSIEYTADVSAIIAELENLWGGDSSGGESGGDTGGADTEALYPLTNASHAFSNSLVATVSNGNHVSLSASSAITATANNATLYVNLSSLSQNGTATNSGNVSLGTTELFTLPGGSEVVLTLKNVVSNGVTLGANGYSVALRDASKTYLKIQNATDFTEQTASKTPEANATIYNVFLFFCGTFEEGATMSFDIELTVDGERWI